MLHLSNEQYLAWCAQQGRQAERETERKISEKVFQAAVVRLAHKGGWLWYHTWSSKRSPEGFPDGCLVHPGDPTLPVYLVELKRATEDPSAAQQAWLDALHGRRIVSEVWRPADLGRIRTLLGRTTP